MRVTVDIDSKGLWARTWRIMLGTALLQKSPSVVRPSAGGRGYHLIWRSLDISFEKSVWYRKILRDDPNRVRLDLECGRSCKQILFTRKHVNWYDKPQA